MVDNASVLIIEEKNAFSTDSMDEMLPSRNSEIRTTSAFRTEKERWKRIADDLTIDFPKDASPLIDEALSRAVIYEDR